MFCFRAVKAHYSSLTKLNFYDIKSGKENTSASSQPERKQPVGHHNTRAFYGPEDVNWSPSITFPWSRTGIDNEDHAVPLEH